MENISALKKLALLGGIDGIVTLSSPEFAECISSSPQTASRRLQTLEHAGYITRKIEPSGQKVMITKQGRMVLETEYM